MFEKPLRSFSRFELQDAQTFLLPLWKKGVDVLASPCVPSSVSSIRTSELPLLPLWEKGAGGMREIVHETLHMLTCDARLRSRAHAIKGFLT